MHTGTKHNKTNWTLCSYELTVSKTTGKSIEGRTELRQHWLTREVRWLELFLIRLPDAPAVSLLW